MTCETARLLIKFGRGELAAEDAVALAAHQADCPACARFAQSLQAGDAAIASAMKAVSPPTGLRAALHQQARALQVRSWRTRWLRRGSAIAAGLIALALGYGLLDKLTRPALDSESLLARFNAGQHDRAPSFENWRQAEGLPPLPVDLNLSLLTFAGRVELAGRTVPAAQFEAGPGRSARVYFIRDFLFNTDRCTDTVTSQGTVRVHRSGRWTIIIIHTGSSLAPFLHPPGGAI